MVRKPRFGSLNEEQQQLVRQWSSLAFRAVNIFYGITKHYWNKDDAISNAMLGLVYAAQSYNPAFVVDGKPVQFQTYAANCIRNELNRGLRMIMTNGRQWESKALPLTRTTERLCVQPNDKEVGYEMETNEQAAWIMSQLPARDREYIQAYVDCGTLLAAGRSLGVTRETIRNAIVRAQMKFSGARHKLTGKKVKKSWRGYAPVRPVQRGTEASAGRSAVGVGE